jgi:hypothetical protein
MQIRTLHIDQFLLAINFEKKMACELLEEYFFPYAS